MRKFGNLEQVVYEPAHYRAGFGLVVIRKRQFLQMREQFVTHVRLYSYADDVTPVCNHIRHYRFEDKYAQQHTRTYKHIIETCGIYHFTRDLRIDEVTHRDDESAE